MLRLLEAGLHSPEHVLFINTMMEVSNRHISSVVEVVLRAPVCLLRFGGCGWVSVYALTWTWIRKATGRTSFQWFGLRVRFELCEHAKGLLLVLKLKRNRRGRDG